MTARESIIETLSDYQRPMTSAEIAAKAGLIVGDVASLMPRMYRAGQLKSHASDAFGPGASILWSLA